MKIILILAVLIGVSLVAGCGGGGGGGTMPGTPDPPPNGLDKTPPAITDVQGFGDSATSVVVTWKTSELSISFVSYGTTQALGSSVHLDQMVTEHSITLTELQPDTTYYFRVSATDAAGNNSVGNECTARTLAITPPPVVQPKGWISYSRFYGHSCRCEDSVESLRGALPGYQLVLRATNTADNASIVIKLRELPIWVPWQAINNQTQDAAWEVYYMGSLNDASGLGESVTVTQIGDASRGIPWKGTFFGRRWVPLHGYDDINGEFEVPDVEVLP